ncbi:MAG: alpha-1,2-fucosyltransferase [Microcystis sp. LE18-22.4A]|jgi:hypothetical protein|uniref:alpha-1,2-fucosyltransferase n=1 Tax=Microcystis sp. LE18-22.4A TaxID=3016432 RepID=UPI0022C6EA29|nr:alpha-1,2-fucosyltransferase [Microcystis sp. LE18-22.4A]MCZ8117885.1 alpha-1,2-fucosyltransferase [Microcystis sp. LE18-22.4A]
MKQDKNLIIFTHGGGRFANQLFSYAHLIAFLAENDYKYDLINLAFWPYAHLLENTSKNLACTFPTKHKQWQALQKLKDILQFLPDKISNSSRIRNNIARFLYNYASFAPDIQSIIAQDVSGLKDIPGKQKDKFDLNNSDDVDLLNLAKVTLLAGWKVRSWPLVEKHQETVRDCLALKESHTATATKFTQELRQKYDYLIGVLIRHYDYRFMLEGKYFFETQQYINWIQQAQDLLGTSSKVGFVIASDEPQDFELFKHLNVHFATGIAGGKGHYLESMAELSQCDMIMTPPSTFGVWAAFLGDLPILPLYALSQVISNQDLLYNNIFDAIAHPEMSVLVK